MIKNIFKRSKLFISANKFSQIFKINKIAFRFSSEKSELKPNLPKFQIDNDIIFHMQIE